MLIKSKLLGLSAALVAAALLTACSSQPKGSSTSDGPRDLAAIKQEGKLYWGSDETGGAPYEFRDPKEPSKRIGFEVEIADELAKRLGVTIEFKQTLWEQIVPNLQRGEFDIGMAGIEITPERTEVVAFSRPYYLYTQQLVVRAEDTKTSSIDDLKGKKIGTLNASAAERYLKQAGGFEVSGYDDNVSPYNDLAIGRLDGVLLDLPLANQYGKPNTKLRFAGEPFAPGEYGIAMRKNAPELKKAIDAALNEMIKDGTLEKILSRWSLWNAAQTKL